MKKSKRKLQPKDAHRFTYAEPPLFAELATLVCQTGILPEKELHECWQMALIVHRNFPDVRRVADLAAGHGLLAWILVLLGRDEVSPRTAVAVDITRPVSAGILSVAIQKQWPELAGSVDYVEGSIDAVRAANGPQTLFVATHACGSLSDRVLIAAIASGSSVAIMPCCHSLRNQGASLSTLGKMTGTSMSGVVSRPDSIDDFRSRSLKDAGYSVRLAAIERDVTGFNRIIIGVATEGCSVGFNYQPELGESSMKHTGEIRAYEKISKLDVSDRNAAKDLALRPSREWLRFFDLSFWLDDIGQEQSLNAELKDLVADCVFDTSVRIQDHFIHPKSQELSVTFRIELKSTTRPIGKDDALSVRKDLRHAVEGRYRLRG